MGFERSYQVKIPSNQINRKRWYTTTSLTTSQLSEKPNLIMNPWFLSGLIDAEGCFTIGIVRNKELKTGWVIKPRFQISLHKKDLALLELIQSTLRIGNINKQRAEAFQFRVDSIKDLKALFNHFEKYPLIYQKLRDYLLFKQALDLIFIKEHLTMNFLPKTDASSGLREIVAIKAAMNNGLPAPLKAVFTHLKSVNRPRIDNISIPDPQWLSGFASGEGCLLIRIKKSNTHKLGFLVELVFQINQHIRDKELILNLVKYLNCGVVYKHSDNAVVFRVSKLSDLTQKIIPFFLMNPILGVKSKDFYDFCIVANIMKEKGHLTTEGLHQIRKIKDGINTGRKFED